MFRVGVLAALITVFGAAPVIAAESAATVAPLQAEQATTEKLGPPKPHWFFIVDVNFLGYLDSHAGAEVLALFRELNAAGSTIVLITHDAGVAAAAGRQVHLRDGRVTTGTGTV